MNGRPTFLHGVGAAALLAFTAGSIVGGLSGFVGPGAAIRLAIPAAALGYVIYLLRLSREPTGRVTTLALWSLLTLVCWWISPPLPLFLLLQVGAVWLIRSLYFYSGVFPALLDLGLSGFAVAAAVWAASQTGSVFVATWCFFLVQALFTAIPTSIKPQARMDAAVDTSKFDRARRQADEALRHLVSGGSS